MKLRWLLLCLVPLGGCGGDLGPGCPGSAPPPPDVSGTWTTSELEIAESTCSSSIDDDILALLEGPGGSCEFDVNQSENAFDAVDCHDVFWQGCVDGSGGLRATQNLITFPQGCTLQADTVFTAASGRSPSTAAYAMTITFTGQACGVLTDCEATVTAVWTESLSPTPQSGGWQ